MQTLFYCLTTPLALIMFPSNKVTETWG